MNFDQLIEKLWDREGRKFGYDSAGIANKFGVNQSTLDRWRDAHSQARGSVEFLEAPEAKQIAYSWYWVESRSDRLPSGLNYLVFQAYYEHPGVAVKWLQQVLGIIQDGLIGPNTLAAISAYPGGLGAVIDAYGKIQADHYQDRYVEELNKGNSYPLKGLLARVSESVSIAKGGITTLTIGLVFLAGLAVFF